MHQLEKPLDDAFKKLPQLPENGRKGLAAAMPWLALAGGVLSLIAAFNLYQLMTTVDDLYRTLGYSAPITGMNGMAWVGVVLLAVEAVLFFVAFPALRTYKKSGWDLVFWAAIVSAAYSVVVNLFGGYLNIGQLIFMLLGAAVGAYLLFQIRPYYAAAGGAKTATIITEEPVKKITTKE